MIEPMSKVTIIIIFIAHFAVGQYPPGFQEESFGSWNLPMNVVFDHGNRMYVSERDGRFYLFQNNQKTLLIDIREEVATYGDFGLLSAALDPNFQQNGYVYLYYVVDRHYLLHFGTNNYSPSTDDQGATICRVTRFTLNPSDGFNSLMPNSRLVLIGESKSSGFPMTGIYHSGGDLKFAIDGSLLVSCGDGASGADYESQALADGIISQEEYDARRLWRCQIPNSLNGKIVRINPANGNGLASNPFYNASEPRSSQSRVYALGFRNPFRFTIKPGTGSHSIDEGNAGVLYVGDVGQDTKEEINVVTSAGQNFGWPRWEGIDHSYENNLIYNPANPKKPTIEWGRVGSNARVVINGATHNVGAGSFPYSNFVGGGAIGGVFYEGDNYPSEYHGSYFFAEFNNRWIQNFQFDGSENPTSKIDFHPDVAGLISFVYNHHDECIYFTAVTGVVKKIKYLPSGNQAPTARFTQTSTYGVSPLSVGFNANISSDPENSPLTYFWNFGDGSTASGVAPSHQFVSSGSSPQSFIVTLTAIDNQGASSQTTSVISLNNTPPMVVSTSLDNIETFIPSTHPSIFLNAEVADGEENNSSLTYKWEVFLYHNDHRHQELNSNSAASNFIFGLVPCSNVLYFYRFILTVSDSHGLQTVFQKDLFPTCNSLDTSPPSFPNLKIEEISTSGFRISWDPITDNDGVKSIQIFVNGKSEGFASASGTNFIYNSAANILGTNFKVYIVARDFAANKTASSIIDFTPNQVCAGGSVATYLSDLQEMSSSNGYGQFEKNQSNGEYLPNDGKILTLNGVTFAKGLGVHAYAEIVYNIAGQGFENFSATVGIDDEVNSNICGSVIFKVYLDDNLAFQSPILNQNSASVGINVSVIGKSVVKLVAENAGDGNCGDHGNWADAKFLKPCVANDVSAPGKPLNLAAVYQNVGHLLSWQPVADNTDGQVEYEIFQDGQFLGSTFATNFVFQGTSSGQSILTVQAKDDSGNRSVSKALWFNNCPSSINLSYISNISSQVLVRKASEFITASNNITNQSNVIYQAGKAITLNPGFSVNQSVFLAKIEGCGN
jgi:glucose/arabinose dehydrogenase